MQIVENSFFNCVSFHLASEMAFLVLVHSRNRPFRLRRVKLYAGEIPFDVLAHNMEWDF